MDDQFSRTKRRHGKGPKVENACKNAKPGPQHLLIKSFLNSFSIHHRGRCNGTSSPVTISVGFFLLESGGANALVIPMFGQKDVLHCQSLGCASSPCLQMKPVTAVHARLTHARKLCLPGLSTGPFAHNVGPTEDCFFLLIIQIGPNGFEKDQTMHWMWQMKQNNHKQHQKR